jgi:ribosome-binding factor A
MTLNKRQREQMRALCEELREDDGIDPRNFFKPSRNRDKEHRKAKQLCRQVQKTLDLVLSGEVQDDSISGLKIVSIIPGADSSQLLVRVVADVPAAELDRADIERRLTTVEGQLRSAVAQAITRKKTPMLVFQILGLDEVQTRENQEEQP